MNQVHDRTTKRKARHTPSQLQGQANLPTLPPVPTSTRSTPLETSRPARSAAPARATRLSKQQALALTQRIKRWTLAGALAVFGVLGGLALGHATGVTASSAAQAHSAGAPSSASASQSSLPGQSNQQAGSQNGSQANQTSGGFFGSSGGFAVGPSNVGSGPVASTSVS